MYNEAYSLLMHSLFRAVNRSGLCVFSYPMTT